MKYKNLFVSYKVAEIVDGKAEYIRNRGLDDSYYKQLIIEYITHVESASRKEITDLLIDKMADVLSDDKKLIK